ncbi:hypothetical protein HS088_TW01G00453 [Tripterygium wilfordii]|uniref:Uncharacterized protein n=1 Tax=Tripterygium wilfordii TaxID=458696 RepID=A0A7J7E1R1_TRIWF|nr:hypothetical protein HS088_TW01G00453 [Tripterygium wilfordii]
MTLIIETCATNYSQNSHGHLPLSANSSTDSGSADLLRHRVITRVLELGIVVHSVVIGISLSASGSATTVKPLIAAASLRHNSSLGLLQL